MYNKRRNKKIFRLNQKRIIGNVLFILLALIFTNMIFSSVTGKKEYKTNVVVVSSNDTLWKIARDVCNNNTALNINKVIYDIKEINHLENANINIGQKLEIPVY